MLVSHYTTSSTVIYSPHSFLFRSTYCTTERRINLYSTAVTTFLCSFFVLLFINFP